MTAAQPIAIINARLLDPASDYDGPGAVLIENGRIVEVIHGQATQRPDGVQIIDAEGRCLAPGLIDTEMVSEEVLEHALALIPMRRMGTVDEVAGAVAFLMGGEASYITRQVISVNGGMVG